VTILLKTVIGKLLGKMRLKSMDRRVQSEEYWKLQGLNVLKCKFSYNKYGGYCVPLSSHHRPAAQRILLNDVYEPETIEYILNHCKTGDVVHAGTYFGDFLPALSNGVAPNAKIWAFEPNLENYRCAGITMALNNITNTVLTHAGLGARQETRLMQTIDDDGRSLGGGSRIIAASTSSQASAEPVPIVSIDDFLNSNRVVSIIQLDVEGFEIEALAGALNTIRKHRPVIILEVLPDSTVPGGEWFCNNILSLGYIKVHTVHGNWVFAADENTPVSS